VIDAHPFQYERVVRPAGPAVVRIVPDGALWEHARPGFADLRVVDAGGAQVPWRESPQPPAEEERPLEVLDSGRRGRSAVARVRTPAPVDRITLEIPDRTFVGVARVYGDGTRIASAQIYSLHGASPARSTTVLLPPNDFHTLDIEASHVSRITGATVHAGGHAAPLVPVRATMRGGVLDLGHANVPVDELRISSTTPRYNRPFTVSAHGAVVASGRLVRLGGAGLTNVAVSTTGRYLRLAIANGDDSPLRGLRVTAYARPRPLLVEGGHRGPLTLYYGASVAAPDYEFARLPVAGTPRLAALGPERANPEYRVVDTRSFFARHRSLVTLALALAAALLVAAGGLALRRT
jgi:hypothetical protein